MHLAIKQLCVTCREKPLKKQVSQLFSKQKGLHPPFVWQLNLQCCCLVLGTERCSTKSSTQSDLHTPSFLSLSRAPCKNSKETSSFSSSHCITNCSNHLQEGQERQQVTARNRASQQDSDSAAVSASIVKFRYLNAVICLCNQSSPKYSDLYTSYEWAGSVPSLVLDKQNTAPSSFCRLLVLHWCCPSPLVFPLSSYLPLFSPWAPSLTLHHLRVFFFSSPFIHVPARTRETSNTTFFAH